MSCLLTGVIFSLIDSGQENVSIANYNYELEQSRLLEFTVNIYAKMCKRPYGPLMTGRLTDQNLSFHCHASSSQWRL
jgi:hypothetical protein